MSEKLFYTTGDLARELGVSIPTIHTYIEKGIITPDRVLPSGRSQFSRQTVEAFLNSLVTNKEDKR